MPAGSLKGLVIETDDLPGDIEALGARGKVLKDAGLVGERKSGRQRFYHLEPEPLREVAEWLSPYERFWREKLRGLRELLDAEAEPGESP